MVEFLKFVFGGFWTWLGFVFIFGLFLNFLFGLYSKALKHKHIMKHGYPPEHCDADGEFPRINEDGDDD